MTHPSNRCCELCSGWKDAKGTIPMCVEDFNCPCHAKPNPTIKSSEEVNWENEVWAWATKEVPNKHADRFIPLFKIISKLCAYDRQALLDDLKKEIGKAVIAEDKVGSFHDGYECLKAQVLALLDKRK